MGRMNRSRRRKWLTDKFDERAWAWANKHKREKKSKTLFMPSPIHDWYVWMSERTYVSARTRLQSLEQNETCCLSFKLIKILMVLKQVSVHFFVLLNFLVCKLWITVHGERSKKRQLNFSALQSMYVYPSSRGCVCVCVGIFLLTISLIKIP